MRKLKNDFTEFLTSNKMTQEVQSCRDHDSLNASSVFLSMITEKGVVVGIWQLYINTDEMK